MLRIAVQAKGRLNEQSMELLNEAGVSVSMEKRKFLMRASDFPAEIIAFIHSRFHILFSFPNILDVFM